MRLLRVSLLRLRDFRLLGLAAFGNSVGMVGEQVVLGWLTLELTDSPLMVGVALGLRMAPLLFVGIPAGVVADRWDRHRLLQASGAAMATASATLGAVTLAGAVALWQVLLLTFAAGCARALYQAARQSYAHDIVGAARLVDGLALVGLAMRIGGLLGSVATGALIARFGSGHAYLAVAAGYLSGVLALVPARVTSHEAPPARDSLWQGLVGFVRAVGRDRMLPPLLVLTAAAEVLGFSHQALLPSLARDILTVGPDGLGVLTAARSIGGILGVVSVSGLGQVRGNGALFLAILFLFGGSLVGLGFAPGFVSVFLILIAVNAIGSVSDVLSQSLIQLSVPEGLRGRAGGAWVLAIGLAPLGQLQIGALASLLSVSLALTASGLGLMAIAAGAAVLFPRLYRP